MSPEFIALLVYSIVITWLFAVSKGKHQVKLWEEQRIYHRAADNIRNDFESIRKEERVELLALLERVGSNPFDPDTNMALAEAIVTLKEKVR